MRKPLLITIFLFTISTLFIKGLTVSSDVDAFYGVSCTSQANCQTGEYCATRYSTSSRECFKSCRDNLECINERYGDFDVEDPAQNPAWHFVEGSEADIFLLDGVYNLQFSESLFDSNYDNACNSAVVHVESSRSDYSISICYSQNIQSVTQCNTLSNLCNISDVQVSSDEENININYKINAVTAGTSGSCVDSGTYSQVVSSPSGEVIDTYYTLLAGGTQDAELSIPKTSLPAGSNTINLTLRKEDKFYCSAIIRSEVLIEEDFPRSNLLVDGTLLANFGTACPYDGSGTKNQAGFPYYNCGNGNSQYKCAIIDISKSEREVVIDDINRIRTDSLQSLGLYSPSIFQSNSSYNCGRCYTLSEPVAVDGDKLVMCGNDGLPLRVDLINNNIADTIAYYSLPENDPNRDFIAECRATGGIPSAIGCIDVTPVGIITGLIRIALGTMGGVALIQLIIVGLRYMQGEEGEIKKAREQLIATLTGLATLVFSVLILRILGVNILDIIPAGTI